MKYINLKNNMEKYRVISEIGKGSYGAVYKILRLPSNNNNNQNT
jgi:hypothetical protein